ncbi:MAG: hypothetical protein J2P17_10180, partial [Mycobacterium sp.]|nr:hypothetical protein [Mycobacterium sp.]
MLATLAEYGAESLDSVSAVLARVTPDRIDDILRSVPVDRGGMILWRFSRYGISAEPVNYLLHVGITDIRWQMYSATRAYVEAAAQIFGEEPPPLPDEPVGQSGIAAWLKLDPPATSLPRDEQECLQTYEYLRSQTAYTHENTLEHVAWRLELTYQTHATDGVITPKHWSAADVETTLKRARARLAGTLPTVPGELATAAIAFAQQLNSDALRRACAQLSPIHGYYAWLRFIGGMSPEQAIAELDAAVADRTPLGKRLWLTPIPTGATGPQSGFTATDLEELEKTTKALIAESLLDFHKGPPNRDLETALTTMAGRWRLELGWSSQLKDAPTAIATLPEPLLTYAMLRYLGGFSLDGIKRLTGWSGDEVERVADDVLAKLTRLTETATATETRNARPDAIVIPVMASDFGAALEETAKLAQQLGCPLIALCIGGLPDDRDNMLQRYPHLTALQLPNNDNHELLPFETGLVLGRLLGWQSVLFLDANIRGLRPEQVTAGVAALNHCSLVGFKVCNASDNSVLRRAGFLTGLPQDTFLSRSALLVNPSAETEFSEHWLFFAKHLTDAVAGRKPIAVAGTASQLPDNPFAHTDQANRENFGNTLAEGIINLLLQGKTLEDANEAYWTRFILDRSILDNATFTWLAYYFKYTAQSTLRTLEATGGHSYRYASADYVEFIQAWQTKQGARTQRLTTLPQLDSITEAAEFLHLQAAGGHTAERDGDVGPNTQVQQLQAPEEWEQQGRDEVVSDAATVWYAPRGVTGTPVPQRDDLLRRFLQRFLRSSFRVDNRLCGLNELLYAYARFARLARLAGTTNRSPIELPNNEDDVAIRTLFGFSDRALAQFAHTDWVPVTDTDDTTGRLLDPNDFTGLALLAFENTTPRSDMTADEQELAVNTHLVTATTKRNAATGELELLVHELVPTGRRKRGRPTMRSVEYRGAQAQQRLAQLNRASNAVHALLYNDDGTPQNPIGIIGPDATAVPRRGPRSHIGQRRDPTGDGTFAGHLIDAGTPMPDPGAATGREDDEPSARGGFDVSLAAALVRAEDRRRRLEAKLERLADPLEVWPSYLLPGAAEFGDEYALQTMRRDEASVGSEEYEQLDELLACVDELHRVAGLVDGLIGLRDRLAAAHADLEAEQGFAALAGAPLRGFTGRHSELRVIAQEARQALSEEDSATLVLWRVRRWVDRIVGLVSRHVGEDRGAWSEQRLQQVVRDGQADAYLREAAALLTELTELRGPRDDAYRLFQRQEDLDQLVRAARRLDQVAAESDTAHFDAAACAELAELGLFAAPPRAPPPLTT